MNPIEELENELAEERKKRTVLVRLFGKPQWVVGKRTFYKGRNAQNNKKRTWIPPIPIIEVKDYE